MKERVKKSFLPLTVSVDVEPGHGVVDEVLLVVADAALGAPALLHAGTSRQLLQANEIKEALREKDDF